MCQIILLFLSDLKLENILLDSNGNCKICDFGGCLDVPKLPENLKHLGKVLAIFNTLEYTAPEFLNSIREFDHSADFWSLGIIIYKLLTNEFPFPNRNCILNNDIPNIKKLELDPDGIEFLKGLLNKIPEERLGSKSNINNIKESPFFNDIDWTKLENKEIDPPYKPNKVNLISISFSIII